jgi:hypothetical protein
LTDIRSNTPRVSDIAFLSAIVTRSQPLAHETGMKRQIGARVHSPYPARSTRIEAPQRLLSWRKAALQSSRLANRTLNSSMFAKKNGLGYKKPYWDLKCV